ncbi:MAG: HAMP domain-containing protein, partial [Desulfosarcina sp.]|nr:HAMP domain-containing protein [Desulfobacterales bacterium]
MLTFLKDLKIQNKFIIIGSTLLLFLAISIVGMLEIAKTTYLQKREREHAVFAEILDFRSKEYIDLLEIGSTASKNKAADLVNQRSSNYQKMGILHLLDEIRERPSDVLNKDVNAIEKVIFRMFGFGELIDICERDVEKCDQLKRLIGRFEDGNVNMERYKEELINGIKFIQAGSNRFSPLLYSASIFVKKIMLSINILFGVITLVLLFFISKIIITPILEITNAARDMAEGDLSRVVNFTSKDELGELSASFNIMVKNTGQLIKNIVPSSDELNNSSSDLS